MAALQTCSSCNDRNCNTVWPLKVQQNACQYGCLPMFIVHFALLLVPNMKWTWKCTTWNVSEVVIFAASYTIGPDMTNMHLSSIFFPRIDFHNLRRVLIEPVFSNTNIWRHVCTKLCRIYPASKNTPDILAWFVFPPKVALLYPLNVIYFCLSCTFACVLVIFPVRRHQVILSCNSRC